MMGYGYENAAGDRISALIDMINGGGPGRSGGTFEGGGILSLLANAVAKPYGSVRERPGHTPMGAAAPTPMEVLRPEPVDAAVLPGSADITIPPYTLALQGERPLSDDLLTSVVKEAIDRADRVFKEEDLAFLNSIPESMALQSVLGLFNGISVGQELTPQESTILRNLRASVERDSGARRF